MHSLRWLGLLIGALFVVGSVLAQASTPWVAFVNESGQLIVTDANGSSRWIVTNPGETLHPTLGYSWSPDGAHLFVATQDGSGAQLRIGDPAAQSLADFGRLEGAALSGGQWQNASTVLVSDGQTVYAVSSQGQNAIGTGSLSSPYVDGSSSVLPANVLPLAWQNGSYSLGSTVLPGSQPDSGTDKGILWANRAPLVAYGAFDDDGASAVYVANGQTGEAIRFNSGGRTPIFPELWLPGSTELLFRDGAGQIRWVDVGCVVSGCGSDPFASSVVILPASASDVQVGQNQLVFRNQEQILRVALTCIAQQNCLETAQVVGDKAAPRTHVIVRGKTALYTAYTSSPLDTADRTLYGLDLSCGDCTAMPLMTNATGLSLDESGMSVIVESSGQGITLLRLDDLSQVSLAGSGTKGLSVRWNR